MVGQGIIRSVKLSGGGELAEVIIVVFPISAIGLGGLDLLLGTVVLIVKRGDVADLEEISYSSLTQAVKLGGVFLGAQNRAILARENNTAHETEVVFVVVNGVIVV